MVCGLQIVSGGSAMRLKLIYFPSSHHGSQHPAHIIGLFTVAVFGPFSTHFQLHFWIIFIVWQKNDYKMKQKMKPKMVTMNTPKCKMGQKCILHGLWQCWLAIAQSALSNSALRPLKRLS
jgi:hypothetical protein